MVTEVTLSCLGRNKSIVTILLNWHIFNAALGCQWVNVSFQLFYLTLKYTVKDTRNFSVFASLGGEVWVGKYFSSS